MAAKGRPTTFTQAVADKIAERLAAGEPLAHICRDPGMPAVRTVSDWKAKSEAFSADIACAREDGFDAIAWRARMTLRGKGVEDGGESTNDVQRDKAIAEFDLKLLAKWDVRRYGDKLAVGGDADAPPIKSQLTVSFV